MPGMVLRRRLFEQLLVDTDDLHLRLADRFGGSRDVGAIGAVRAVEFGRGAFHAADPVDRHEAFREQGAQPVQLFPDQLARKSVVEGKSVSVRVDLGGRRFIKKQKYTKYKKLT